MRMKEKHLKGFRKLKKQPNVRKKHINVKVLGVKFLAWGEVESLRGKKLETDERLFSARDIRFLGRGIQHFQIQHFKRKA